MFSSLTQGSAIYILDKNESRLKTGSITSISFPHINSNPSLNIGNQQVIDIKCQVDGNPQEFINIPTTYSLLSYNNGQIIISETKQNLQQEVETTLQKAQEIVRNIDTYKEQITAYEQILKELNPQFARDTDRDNRLTALEDKFEGVTNKLDKLIDLVTKK